MSPLNLAKLLKDAFLKNRRVLIKGKPGIGKSDIVAQVCRELGFDLVISHPAISDPTDFKGMPALVNNLAEFLPFGDLRQLIEATKPTIFFEDDIGQASGAVQAALMQLNLARRVNGHCISDKVIFCGATNDTSHCAGVSGMIEPLKSRWDTIIELEVSIDDWCLWALNNNMPPELMAYLRWQPQDLSDFKPTKELRNSPSPRGWASIGHWFNDGVKTLEVFEGAVGEGAARKFFGFLDSYANLPPLDGIIMDPDGSIVPDKPGQRYAVAVGLARKAAPGNFERIIRYLERLPEECNICSVRDAIRLDRKNAATAAYTQWSIRHQDVLI